METHFFWIMGRNMLVEEMQTEEPWSIFFSDDSCHQFLLVFPNYTTPVVYGCHISVVEDLIELKNCGCLTESSRAVPWGIRIM